MKFRIFLGLLAITFLGHAQQRVSAEIQNLKQRNTKFTMLQPFSASTQMSNSKVEQVVGNATYLTLNQTVLTDISAKRYDAITVQIPYNNQILLLDLYRVELFAEGFHIDTDKAKNLPYNKGLYYRGIIRDNLQSVASFNFFESECNAVISDRIHSNLVVGKLLAEESTDYIVYSDANMLIPNGLNCKVKDGNFTENTVNERRSNLSERCVTTYFELDNDLFLANNSSIELTTNWMTSVFNNVQTIFANDGITTALKSLFIWTEVDPYEGESSVDYLFQFNEVRPVFDGDVGQLVGLDPGGLGGVAVTIDGLCNQNNFSYSDVDINFSSVPVFSWTILVITHELGHLLGSRHTHACAWNGDNTSIDGCGTQAGYQEGNCDIGPIPGPDEKGTIMSYCHLIGGVGISFANGFGPQPAEAILFKVETSNCLSTDCINTCINTIGNIAATNVTTTSATLSWTDLAQAPSSYQVAVSPLNGAPGDFVSVSDTSLAISGLQPNTFYVAELKPICDNAEAVIRRKIFATDANWCAGTTITDTGGTFGNYNDMESYTRVLIPNLPSKAIRIDFLQFSLELDYDYLYIYDGPSTESQELTGGLTGSFNPGSYTSTSPDGALTLKFTSDQFITDEGYVAAIGCEENLSAGEFNDILDFSYFPNPTKQMLNLRSNQEFHMVTIYNLQGRLLYQSHEKNVAKTVDLSSFASGTYLCKVQIGDRTINFKVVKDL